LPWQRRIFAVALKPSRRGFSGTPCCLSGANILFAGNAPTIRNLGTSPPLLDECVGDFASTETEIANFLVGHKV
jgi:hypothetical protein